ncbi:MAG: hypothetical protein Q4G34_00965 [Micrococcus sp.]|nr:hypothetical protein [Micrococcus sp.]
MADTTEIVHHLSTYLTRVIERGQTDIVDLPLDLQDIARYVLSEQPEVDLAHMEQAWRIVTDGEPVRGAAPHSTWRENESHRRWKGPLTPLQIVTLAQDAPADAGTYRENLVANTAFHQARANREEHRASLTCDRPTAAGHPCRAATIYLPAGDGTTTAAEGLPCRSHVTEQESATITEVYDAAIRAHDCPGCTATAGQSCVTGPNAAAHLRLVEGEWARTRSFCKRSVHDVRLVAATEPPSTGP